MKRYYLTALFMFIFSLLIYFSVFHPVRETKPRTSGAMKALTFWTRSRAYPNVDIPQHKFYKAYEKSKAITKISVSDDDLVSSWQQMGPYNVPGRMISVAVNPKNPNTLYTGSASGGLWRTYHAKTGKNWHRIRTGFPTLGIMGLCIDPADTNTIYIGTGEVYGYQRSIGGSAVRTTRGSYGLGILKTRDGGATWEKSLDWTYNQERGVQAIRINPHNSNSLFAATSEGIYKTTDAGATWELVLPVLMGQDIVIHHIDTTKIMVSCGNLASTGRGLYRSTDGGKNWNKLSGLPNYTGKTLLAAYGNNPDMVFASIADSLRGYGLYRTDNFGDNWKKIHGTDVQRYQGWFSHWVAVKPTDSTQVVHAGVQIFKSANGGKTLTQKSGIHVDHHNFAIDPADPNVLYAACDGGVYRSENFGDSYSSIGYGLQTAQFYNGFSSSYTDSTLALGGLQDNNTVIYSGTREWRTVIGGDGCWTAINSFNDNILYGEYQYNNIYKSTNRGLSFSSAISGISQQGAAFVAPFVISESNPSILYSGRRTVFKTTDGADSWFATNDGVSLDGNPILSLAVSSEDPDIAYAGTAPVYNRAHIFMTLDGDIWEDVTEDLPDRYPMDLAIDPNDKHTAYVVFGGFGSGHIYKTEDDGSNWTDITGSLPDVPTLAVTVDPLNSDHIYLGNDLGVYVSTDAGENWTEYNKGLPEAVIAMDVSISPANRFLRLATHGNGAYQRPLVYEPDIYISLNLLPFRQISLLGDEVSFAAQATNFGKQVQSDTISIELRVLDPAENLVFQSFQSVYNLGSKETVVLEFEEPFSATMTGMHTVVFTRQDAPAEAISQSLEIISLPSIAQAIVTKKHTTYKEISNGVNLPKGDDVQSTANLPFDFEFDGFIYNKIQVSTNGWLEFGIGLDGTERGLSTEDQIGNIGANENGRMASKARPSKALGPWWEDLNTDASGNTGQMSYKTLGSSPDRVFVMQWKNMRAYYSEATTTRINFQVRLYETSNLIEYHYGPVTAGTFSGADLGAMIGFKDHIGGDYHFYDIAAGGTTVASDIRTDLSPLLDWPGPDSVYVIHTTSTGIDNQPDAVPERLILAQNYPNPFNPTTTIPYQLQEKSHVELHIFNITGQKIQTLVNQNQLPGSYIVTWDGKNMLSQPVSSGMYLYVLKNKNQQLVRRMLLLK